MSVAGLEQLENTVVQVTDAEGTNKATFTLRLEASSTHQERSCEVSISVVSEGDNAERSSTFNVNVEAPTAEEETPVSDGEGDDERPSVPESTSLPSLSLVELLAVLMFVSFVVLRPRD